MNGVDCKTIGGDKPGVSGSETTGAAEVTISHATSAEELTSCYTVVAHLRPQLDGREDWCARARCMHAAGYRVLVCRTAGEAQALAGYRIMENLIHGRFLYVDDLVASPEYRGQRLGARLLSALSEIARQERCKRLVLDTSATNLAAQRFYQREGLQPAIIGFVKAV